MPLQSKNVVLNIYLVRVTGRSIIEFTFLVSERELGSLKATGGAYATLLTNASRPEVVINNRLGFFGL